MSRFFMSYATANEADYFADFLNFQRLANFDPGVSKVEVFITISEVQPKTKHDDLISQALVEIAEKNPKVQVQSVIFKSNVGRDFSSAALALQSMIKTGNDEDFALFVNRSGFGPYCSDWYLKYQKLLRQSKATLVGSTINGFGHPKGKFPGQAPHVQTYCYCAQLRNMRQFVENFPAAKISDRIDLIEEGEIGISSKILSDGGTIACLNWPELIVSKQNLDAPELKLGDVKQQARNLPFLYKNGLWWRFIRRQQFRRWQKTILCK